MLNLKYMVITVICLLSVSVVLYCSHIQNASLSVPLFNNNQSVVVNGMHEEGNSHTLHQKVLNTPKISENNIEPTLMKKPEHQGVFVDVEEQSYDLNSQPALHIGRYAELELYVDDQKQAKHVGSFDDSSLKEYVVDNNKKAVHIGSFDDSSLNEHFLDDEKKAKHLGEYNSLDWDL